MDRSSQGAPGGENEATKAVTQAFGRLACNPSSEEECNPPTALDVFPAEILHQIFGDVLSEAWNGKEIPLLAALRSSPKHYKIAIKIFYDTQVFRVTKGATVRSLNNLSETSRASIKHLAWTLT
jgi:hypothetical protein